MTDSCSWQVTASIPMLTVDEGAMAELPQQLHHGSLPETKGGFEQVRKPHPGHPHVAGLIEKSQRGVDEGRDRTPAPAVEQPEQQERAPELDHTVWVLNGIGVCGDAGRCGDRDGGVGQAPADGGAAVSAADPSTAGMGAAAGSGRTGSGPRYRAVTVS